MNSSLYSDELFRTLYYCEGKLVYKKLKNRYRIFCMKCMQYEYVSPVQFKQIQAARICPMCHQEVKLTTVLEQKLHRYIMGDNYDGYLVWSEYKFGCKPKWGKKLVARKRDGILETRFIFCNMGAGFCYNPSSTEWKKRYNTQAYLYRFYSIQTGEPVGKKEYIYKALFDRGIMQQETDKLVKSNQKKILIDNLLNGRQMEFVIAFDLKSYDQVYKYRTYMASNEPDVYRPLNIYYLDYLVRNKIRLRDFYDYLEECDILGFKHDKPADFQHRHMVLSDMVAKKQNEEMEQKAKERYSKLLQKAYSSGTVKILPFKNCDEIRKCGKQLHNCIATYIDLYADGKSDLFYLKKKGKVSAAIEVRSGKLTQARVDRNQSCPADLMKHVRKWCMNNGITVGDDL